MYIFNVANEMSNVHFIFQRHYNNFALFFHDSYGGDVIAVLWKPTVYQQEDFKVIYNLIHM